MVDVNIIGENASVIHWWETQNFEKWNISQA